MTPAPAGWYADPTEAHELRYWDGGHWSDHVADDGVQSRAPLRSPPGRVSEADSELQRGVRLEAEGDLSGAEAAYRQSDALGSAGAALSLGLLLKRRGDRSGAEAAYRRSEERGEARAACNLGVLLEEAGDLAGAEAAYRRADASGFPGGAYSLGQLLYQRGDLPGALDANRRADAAGDADAALNLGVLLAKTGDLGAAEAAFRRAEERGVVGGGTALGRLMEDRGDVAAAEAAYRRADGKGDPGGSFNLGALLLRAGDAEGLEAIRRAGARGYPGASEFLQLFEQQLAASPEQEREQGSVGLRFDGLYECPSAGFSRFLRFSMDGRAFGVSTTGSSAEVGRWLGVNPALPVADVVRLNAETGEVEFSLRADEGRIDHHGRIGADGDLVLDLHSHINGNRTQGERYRFVPVADLPDPAPRPGAGASPESERAEPARRRRWRD